MKMNKKGFTIVELVIVIVVIAILAAVLIPTFVSLTRKANIANDTAVAKNLNTAAISASADSFDEAIEAAKDAGYLIANLNSKAKDCYFVWEDDSNQFLLYDLKEAKVIYSNTEDYGEIDASWCFVISDMDVANSVKEALPNVTIKQAVASVSNLKEWITSEGTQVIYIDESIEIDSENQIVVSGGDITLKLFGATVTGNNDDTYTINNVPFMVTGGKLTIEGGTIGGTGSYLDADGDPVDSAVIADSGVLNLVDTVVDCAGKSIVIAYDGEATGTISNTKVIAGGQAVGVFGGSQVVLENCDVNTGWEALFVSNAGGVSKATVKSGTYNCDGNTVVSHGGEIVIEGGAFSSTQYNLFKLYSTGSSITIKGGTFTTCDYDGYTLDMLTVEVLKGMIATTSDNYDQISIVENADGSFTITN